MNLKKIGSYVWWVLAQVAIIGIVWGGVHGSTIDWNIYKFLAWFATILYCFIDLAKVLNPTQTNKSIPTRKIPIGLSFGSDFAIAIILAAFGHWFYATLKVIEQFAEQFLLDKESGPQKG